MTKNRLEAFSDGVIAIIITIMVLELKVPHGNTIAALKPMWPLFLSYIVSFIMIGIYWGNHHHLVHTIKGVTGNIIWANLHLLFWLSLIPFATAWLSESEFARFPIALYALLLNLCGMAYYIMLMIIKKCNPHNEALLAVLHKQSRKGIMSLISYTCAIIASFINPLISGAFIILVAVLWLIPDKNIESVYKN